MCEEQPFKWEICPFFKFFLTIVYFNVFQLFSKRVHKNFQVKFHSTLWKSGVKEKLFGDLVIIYHFIQNCKVGHWSWWRTSNAPQVYLWLSCIFTNFLLVVMVCLIWCYSKACKCDHLKKISYLIFYLKITSQTKYIKLIVIEDKEKAPILKLGNRKCRKSTSWITGQLL